MTEHQRDNPAREAEDEAIIRAALRETGLDAIAGGMGGSLQAELALQAELRDADDDDETEPDAIVTR